MSQSRNGGGGNNKSFATQQSLNGAIKSICDIMRRSNCAGALQDEDTRTPEELLDVIDAKGQELAQALEALRMGGRAV
jgi:type I restriction enzyme M protein